MPTIERRLNRAGEVVAVRVKVRRAGQPHLSRTFALAGPGASALRAAEVLANDWMASLDRPLGQAFARAQADAPGMQALTLLAALRAAPTPRDRALFLLALDTGQSPEVLARLRWQQVDIAERRMEVLSISGRPLRQVPLGDDALDALLALRERKYGPVFKRDAAEVQSTLEAMLAAAGLTPLDLYRAAARRWAARGHGPQQVAALMGLGDLSPLGLLAKMGQL